MTRVSLQALRDELAHNALYRFDGSSLVLGHDLKYPSHDYDVMVGRNAPDGAERSNQSVPPTPYGLVGLRARWVTLRARWVTLRAHWATLRARWVTLRARWVTLRAH